MSFDEGREFYEFFCWTCAHNNQVKNASMILKSSQMFHCSHSFRFPIHNPWHSLISFLLALPYSEISYSEIIKYVVYEFGFFHLA